MQIVYLIKQTKNPSIILCRSPFFFLKTKIPLRERNAFTIIPLFSNISFFPFPLLFRHLFHLFVYFLSFWKNIENKIVPQRNSTHFTFINGKKQKFLYIIFLIAEPLPLMDLCRLTIRQQVGKENLTQETLDTFDIPRQMRQYLVYKW